MTIENYYNDQINFYKNRVKRFEKNIKNKEKIGLPVTELDLLILNNGKEVLKLFENKLKNYLK